MGERSGRDQVGQGRLVAKSVGRRRWKFTGKLTDHDKEKAHGGIFISHCSWMCKQWIKLKGLGNQFKSINELYVMVLHAATFSPASFYVRMGTFFSLLILPSTHASVHPSAHGWMIAANLSQGSLEGVRSWSCSTGLLNRGEGEWVLRGRLNVSLLPATLYWWEERREREETIPCYFWLFKYSRIVEI